MRNEACVGQMRGRGRREDDCVDEPGGDEFARARECRHAGSNSNATLADGIGDRGEPYARRSPECGTYPRSAMRPQPTSPTRISLVNAALADTTGTSRPCVPRRPGAST